MKYVIIKLPEYLDADEVTEEVFSSDSAKDIGVYLWGKYIGEYAIYKNNKLARSAYACGSISELEYHLEHL